MIMKMDTAPLFGGKKILEIFIFEKNVSEAHLHRTINNEMTSILNMFWNKLGEKDTVAGLHVA